MKLILIILSIITTIACNQSGGGGSGDGAPSSPMPWNTFSIATASDLPTCAGDIIGRLYYIEATSLFQVCKTTGWANINIKGADGTNGISVSSSKTISASNSDYCTQITGESCYFDE
jgi:hypothetical protein